VTLVIIHIYQFCWLYRYLVTVSIEYFNDQECEFMILISLPSLTIATIAQITSMTTTKLTAKNYLAWKDLIRPLFENVNLLDHISTKVEEPQKFNIVGDRSGTQPMQLGGKMISL
jgi:hypothetical protein